ncbi:putative TIM-barrel fold metal-dependent hydrolase [Humitalea rosea]|uniref:Putative TIM-barrel fold metal-dependent hydrolase n=1 Tax=Humitalea rosea TaxID=990373 RepID=A0A2W7I6V2_9PROT|nr:amidohydrolase family protein [Humitalea rosea]PZW41898.1 putative TIM-barrel fold metal-dependent hydrolase [Humitalea rosea]
MSEAPFCAAPDRAPRSPALAVPPLACDSHLHVFGPAPRYPYQATRGYTPPDSPVPEMQALHRALGIGRAVLVQASVHGTDNSAILDAVAADPTRYRAIASVGEDVTDAELERLHAGGVRGFRVNLVDKGGMPFRSLSALSEVAERVRPFGWHAELLVHVHESDEFRQIVRRLPIPVCVGHLGYTKAGIALENAGYREFLALLRDGRCWVKLTGPYRISAADRAPYADVVPLARAVVATAPDRVVWGSDWPHVMLKGVMPNDGDLLDLLGDWVPDAALRHRILVDNPATLYGFEP